MVRLQFDAKSVYNFIQPLLVEIEKNPDGFINIEFHSQDKSLAIPAVSWSTDLGELNQDCYKSKR